MKRHLLLAAMAHMLSGVAAVEDSEAGFSRRPPFGEGGKRRYRLNDPNRPMRTGNNQRKRRKAIRNNPSLLRKK